MKKHLYGPPASWPTRPTTIHKTSRILCVGKATLYRDLALEGVFRKAKRTQVRDNGCEQNSLSDRENV